MIILSIDTSCDETAVAVTDGRKILSNAIYSQILIHKKWGGVVPSLAKRAHEERIDMVILEALEKAKLEMGQIDVIAVTQGPGLAIALEVGMQKAKELAKTYGKKLIAVNHMEGHIYSCFAQNSKGNPKREFAFPYLALLISGGHTELVILKGHVKYEMIGSTRDDAAGEALDKAGKLLGLGYPAGEVIERLANEIGNKDIYVFPRPMLQSGDLNFSFSGLKTSFYYFLKKMEEKEKVKNIRELASSFQTAVFETLTTKLEKAIIQTGISKVLVGGGVANNHTLRGKIRLLVKKHIGLVYFPPYKYLNSDNAAMIGVVASFKAERGMFIKDFDSLDRSPRLQFDTGI